MSGQPPPAVLATVIIPCRNEREFIGSCLDSLIAGDFPRDRLEVLVADGMSDDGTREVVRRYQERYPFVRLLDNPKRVTPAALNLGIRAARGAVIFRMDVRSRWAPDYVSQCLRLLRETGADCVGGAMITETPQTGLLARAIVAALSHPFGVGNSYFRVESQRARWVDTVFGGGYRREVFADVGLFNEQLVRGQDMEFSLRMRRAGKRVLLTPAIRSYYVARAGWASFWSRNWANGVWAVRPFLFSRGVPVGWRHLVPLAFVLALLVTGTVGWWWRSAWWFGAALAVTYLLAAGAAAAQVAAVKRDWRYLIGLPPAFASLHLAYGLGSLVALLQILPPLLLHGRGVPAVERL